MSKKFHKGQTVYHAVYGKVKISEVIDFDYYSVNIGLECFNQDGKSRDEDLNPTIFESVNDLIEYHSSCCHNSENV